MRNISEYLNQSIFITEANDPNFDLKTLISQKIVSFDEPFAIQYDKSAEKTYDVLKSVIGKSTTCQLITIYLEKAEATDFEELNTEFGKVIPGWVSAIGNADKNKKFVVAFAGIDGAKPEVLNALMPIALKGVLPGVGKKDNFICTFIGNEDELKSLPKQILSKMDKVPMKGI